MPRLSRASAGLALLLAVLLLPAPAGAQSGFEARQLRYPRVRAAHRAQAPTLRQRLEAHGIAGAYRLYLRAFKHERTLEVWAAPLAQPADSAKAGVLAGPYVLLQRMPFCATSGQLGPKRAAGDGQIPEGFYTIDRFNPQSNFHLSLGLDYPNAVDRARAGRSNLGADIFIHGACVTIGCIPLTDPGIEELYLLAVWARSAGQRSIPVHIFPSRPGAEAWPADADGELRQLYTALALAYRDFAVARQRRVPQLRATARGYVRLN